MIQQAEPVGRSSDEEGAHDAYNFTAEQPGCFAGINHRDCLWEEQPENTRAFLATFYRFAFAAGSASVQGPADVERVAAAIYDAKHPHRSYADLQDEKREDFRYYARAAIAAGSASSVDRERVREMARELSRLTFANPRLEELHRLASDLESELRRLCDGE